MLEWIISSSFLILIVLLLRTVLGKRISAGLRYALWAVVLVRLLVPVSFLALSVPQLPTVDPSEAMLEASIYILPVDSRPLEDSGVHVTEDGTLIDPGSFGYARLEDEGQTVTRYAEKISLLELLGWVWIAGAVGMGVVLATANLRFFTRLRRVRRSLEGTSAPIPVYVAAGLPSPCLMGLLEPAVYMTEEAAADPAMLRHVLAHELTHYNHRDHLWSALRGIALAVHWWNPLVWLAVVCSRRDGELACDEGALRRLGDGERTAYGETLLALVTAKSRPGDLLCFATTMTGGKRTLKERIQRIAKQPKTLVSAIVAVVIVLSLSVLVAFGQAKETPEEVDAPAGEPLPVETQVPDADAWRTVDFVLTVDGVIELGYDIPGGGVEIVRSNPVPAPREWADPDTLDSRKESTALEGLPIIWAELVSETDGWLVATYGRGVAAADTYVYKTEDGGINWTEVTMPGTNWHISDVGFLSPDRLIVAQRLFDGAPCFITRDGGATWEEIELPDKVVTAIHSETVTMFVGPNETDRETYVMTSEDLGDHWTVTPVKQSQTIQADLDHDGRPDTLTLRKTADSGLTLWSLEFTPSNMSSPTWEGEAATPHAGWTAFFLYQMEGEDYLLQYTPYMGGGICYYSYKLFYLTADGGEVAVQENSVEFDINFGSAQHQYNPEAIDAFIEEINALLAHSEVLVNTDENLLRTFQKESRLYDSIWWLEDDRDDSLTLLENLRNYGSYAADHPDDTWSPLADLLMGLEEEDIPMFNGDTAELVRLLRSAERESRFYTWASETDAYLGAGADEVDYTIWNLPLANGSTLWLMACEERDSVFMIYEMPTEAVSAFYDAPGLKNMICQVDTPSMAEVMANIQEEDIKNLDKMEHRPEIAEALHRISGKLFWDGNGLESDTIISFIPVGYQLSPDEQFQHIYLKAVETENYLRIVCKGVTYKVVCYVEDAEVYQSVCSWGIRDEELLARYQDD